MKIWSYVGRFIWGFALIEYQVNQLFEQLIRVDFAASVLLTYTLDLRKKLNVIEVLLASQGNDQGKTFKRIHALHDLRNVIAHWPFFEEMDETGLWCDYVNKDGDTDFRKPRISEKDNHITYDEFDAYDVEASALYEILEGLVNSATPITEVSDNLRLGIEEAISSSDNVVRFPSKLRKDVEGKAEE
jgi:hypothetical protein